MNLEKELQKELVAHLNLSNFTSVEIGISVKRTVEKMREEKNTCAIITDQGALVGIFTEHDILAKIVDNPETWLLPIDDFITPSPLTVRDEDSVQVALAIMEEKQFRNVPVLNSEGKVVGNLTHYAIIKYLADRFPETVYNLSPDPDRTPRKRDGA